MLQPQPGVLSVPHTSRYTSEDRTPPSGRLSHTSITPPITFFLLFFVTLKASWGKLLLPLIITSPQQLSISSYELILTSETI